MEIEIFTLCDFAQDNNSKLTVVGTFDSINSKQFPYVHGNFSVACRLRFSEKEIGIRDMRLRFIDGKGGAKTHRSTNECYATTKRAIHCCYPCF